jgi:hypothetical protein
MFDKKLLAVAAASGLMAVVSAAFAQVAYEDSLPAQQTVEVTAPKDQAHILYFVDQGNSPESDPAAHLALIKDHQQPQPVAAVEERTTVAQAETQPAYTEPAPAPAAAPAEEAAPQTENLTEKSTAPDNMPAPRADRN